MPTQQSISILSVPQQSKMTSKLFAEVPPRMTLTHCTIMSCILNSTRILQPIIFYKLLFFIKLDWGLWWQIQTRYTPHPSALCTVNVREQVQCTQALTADRRQKEGPQAGTRRTDLHHVHSPPSSQAVSCCHDYKLLCNSGLKTVSAQVYLSIVGTKAPKIPTLAAEMFVAHISCVAIAC